MRRVLSLGSSFTQPGEAPGIKARKAPLFPIVRHPILLLADESHGAHCSVPSALGTARLETLIG